MFGEAMVSSVTGKTPPPHNTKKADSPFVLDNGLRPGIVTVIDVLAVRGDHVSVISNLINFKWLFFLHKFSVHLYIIWL